MKRVAILGGGPAGAFAAEKLASAGLGVVLMDEKLAWEKPCGGGLTYKAYSQYPFLIEQFHSQADGHRDRAGRAQGRRGHAEAGRPAVDLFALRPEPHAAGARRAGRRANREDARDGHGAPGRGLATAHRERQRRRGFLHRRHRRAQSAARRRDTAYAAGYHVGAGLLRAGRSGAASTFSSCRTWKATSGSSRAAAIFRWAFAARASRRHCCASGWKPTWPDAASVGRTRPSTATCCPRWIPRSWKENRVAGDGWMAVGDAAGLVDPITGEGLYYAIRSGDLAAQSLLADAGGPAESLHRYRTLLRRDFAADLEFGSRLAKRVFLGRFLCGSVPQRMVEFTRRSPALCRRDAGSVRRQAALPGAEAPPDAESQRQPVRDRDEPRLQPDRAQGEWHSLEAEQIAA